MTKLLKKIFLVVFAAIVSLTVVACGDKEDKTQGNQPSAGQETEVPTEQPTEVPTEKDPYAIELPVMDDFTANSSVYGVDYQAYLLLDLYDVANSFGTLTGAAKEGLYNEYQKGVTAIKAATTNAAAQAAFETAKAAMINVLPKANGVYNYVDADYAAKAEITGTLEAYAVRNGITGISLFENGGYVMYHERITLGTENYITGFGFGTLAHGSINADLETETDNPAWKRYYHTSDASDPGTANYLNDEGSQVGDYFGYMGSSFFTTFMNSTKDGYDWVPELAKALPTPVVEEGASEEGLHTTWRFPVRVGSELKYSTASTEPSRAAYNNRQVAAEDYLTPFKVLLTKATGYFRGSELAGATTGAIKGAKAYYAASEAGFNEEAWENVGLHVYEEGGQTWFEVEYTEPTNQFYAMYYIASSLYSPFPQEFFDLVGKDAYLGYNSDKSLTPVDNSLSLGAYMLEYWETDKAVAYKKNPNYVYADKYYSIPGVKITILKAAATDPNATIKEFEKGNLDSCGIPQEYLQKYKNDPRTRTTTGDSVFKLNVNATDEATWEYLFGENGVVSQTSKSNYWKVEPALSNAHFVKALSLSIDRVTFADKRGSIGSVNYLSSNYMADPEKGISYSTTEAHKAAVANLLRDTDGFGYSLELAREYYKVALEELINSGKYTAGTAENPTVIELEVAWMYPQHETMYHAEIEQFLETAFNHESVSNGQFKLDVKFWVGDVWNDVYYKKLMKGQYDLGFGSISGNALNPLDFLSVLSSDQNISGNFTLNWGTDTNDSSADVLVYDGMQWSFDALWKAGNGTAIVQDGELVSIYNGAQLVSETPNADGTHTVVFEVGINSGEGYTGAVADIVIYGYSDTSEGSDYTEVSVWESVTVSELADGKVTVTVVLSAEHVAAYKDHVVKGLDVYFSETVNGVVGAPYYAGGVDVFVPAE